MADKLDPFNVDALEKSVNDSAVRVSTIWVSFLIFALYLVISAGTITHRQLFLEEPVKLPVLNIDLPIWGFFFLAPILFVIFHAYVLLQVLLLGRTAAAYNEAVDRAVTPPSGNASMRQRLANTLFAQIFAGSPRERGGPIGGLLKLMAWVTLAVAPVLVLLVFQFKFLPYHSHFVTWTHRLLILLELATVFLLWPLVLDATREIEWRRVVRQPVTLISVALFVLVSLSLATFPGEPHANLFTGQSLQSVGCKRWISGNFDRLDLLRVDVVDDEKLDRIERATTAKGLAPSAGERTRNFRERNLTCGVFDWADLRRADFAGAHMRGTSLRFAELQGAALGGAQLQGAALGGAQLQGAALGGAQLQGASLFATQLQGASLNRAQLQGASLNRAQLQGASLNEAQLQGASLNEAQLQGASLDVAQLQGASLNRAQLQGASLFAAQLQGASLFAAQLQGASLNRAQLQGASLDRAQLQGADLEGSDLALSWLANVRLWRANGASCSEARTTNPRLDAVIELKRRRGGPDAVIRATPEAITKFIERTVADVPDSAKDDVRKRMSGGLIVDSNRDDTAAIDEAWRDCAADTVKRNQTEYDQEHVAHLRDLACNASTNGQFIAKGIIRNWISANPAPARPTFSQALARGLLGLDGKECPAAKELDERTKERLQAVLASPPQ